MTQSAALVSAPWRPQARQVMQDVQQVLTSELEQQLLLPFLCWAAARGGITTCVSEHNLHRASRHTGSSAILLPSTLDRFWGCLGSCQLNNSCSTSSPSWPVPAPNRAGSTGRSNSRCSPAGRHRAAAPRPSQAQALQQRHPSSVCLQLLAALLAADCLQGQLSWLQRHLQQQLWAAREQQHEDGAGCCQQGCTQQQTVMWAAVLTGLDQPHGAGQWWH